MSIKLQRIEALAPDQDSLVAARKLLKPSAWPTRSSGDGLIWGECQGSGATPYRVVVHEADAGYKCTCPSRKFPCKHALALMWMRAEGAAAFTPAPVPDWVKDWLSRRRGTSTGSAKSEEDGPQQPKPSVRLTEVTADEANVSAKAEERAAAARERNRLDRETAVLAGLDDLDTWLFDQVQQGMASFVAQSAQACRTIAQRLVDAKAVGLAGRLDALPTRLFTLPGAARPAAAIRELGQLHLISETYRRAAELPVPLVSDARQAIGWPITREALLNDPNAPRVSGKWLVFAVLSDVQPDRLRRMETRLFRQGSGEEPRFAVLIDFVPVSTGSTATSGYLVGDEIDAEFVFYPSTIPLRAQIATLKGGAEQRTEPAALPDDRLNVSYGNFESALAQLPWLGTLPLPFRSARVRRNGEQLYLCDADSGMSLPLHSSQTRHALPLTSLDRIDGIGLWNGYEFTLTWAETPLGRWMMP